MYGGIVYAEEPTFNSKGKIVYEGTTLFDSADLTKINTDIKSVLNKTNKNTTDIATLNNNLGGNIITYNESEDAYYIQHGADSVPKKLGKSSGQVEFVVSTGGKEEHWSTVSFQNIDEKTLVIKRFSGTSKSDSGNSFYKLGLSINYKDGTSTSDYIYDSTADTDSGHASVNQTLNWEYEIKNASSVTLSAGTRGYGDRVYATFVCAWE